MPRPHELADDVPLPTRIESHDRNRATDRVEGRFVISHSYCETADPPRVLLIVARPSSSARAVEFLSQRAPVGDRVVRQARKWLGKDAIELGLGSLREKNLSRIGLYNSYIGLILAFTSLTLPFSLWMLKGYTDTIPRDLDDAAMVDGCTSLGAFRRVIFPLVAPGVVATLVFAFLLAWGDLLWALVLTSGDDMATLTLGLTRLVTQFRTVWPQLMAGSVVAALPSIVLYVWLQRYLVEGISGGAVK